MPPRWILLLIGLSASQQGTIERPAFIEEQTTWACEADVILEGDLDGIHRGLSLADAGHYDTLAGPDLLLGGGRKLDTKLPPATTFDSAVLFKNVDLSFPQCDPVPDIRLNGAWKGDRFGWDLDYVGDIDGDGRDDFVVGAPRSPRDTKTKELLDSGYAYVFLTSFFDPAPAAKEGVFSASSASVVIRGPIEDGRFGFSVSRAGDFIRGEGEPHPDFAVGAPGWWESSSSAYEGRVYVFSGRDVLNAATPGSTSYVDVWELPNTEVFGGTADADALGYAIGWAGDVDGDGSDALVIGAPQFRFDPGHEEAPHEIKYPSSGPGYAVVVRHAHDSSLRLTLLTPPDGQWGQWFGASVDGAFDIGGGATGGPDGRAEVIVGAPAWDSVSPEDPVEQAGKARVFLIQDASAPLFFEARGETHEEFFGATVRGLGNVLGGSSDDFAIASLSFDTVESEGGCAGRCRAQADTRLGGSACGRVFVFDGSTLKPSQTYTGEDPKDSLGWAIARIGDVGGSAFEDLLFAGPRWPGGPSGSSELGEAGRIYLFVR